MKKITGFLVGLLLLAQVPYVEAESANEDLYLQLTAISEYLENELSANTTPLKINELKKIIIDGTNWIVTSQEDSGRFGYEYYPYDNEYSNDDNMVRQAGTLSVLAEVYKKQSVKDIAYAESIERSINYFESFSEEVESSSGKSLCIKSTSRSSKCELGTVSLALIGILNYVEGNPERESEYEELIENYANFLITAKRPGKGFSNKYILGEGYSSTESPFYNGEAMLALVRYYQYKPNEEVKEILEKTAVYLMFKDEYETPLYLWIMAALKDMQKLWPNDAYIEYSSDFTKFRLVMASLRHGTSKNYCAPLEGLTSAYSILENDESVDYMLQLSSEIDFWQTKTTWLQLDGSSPYRLIEVDGVLSLVRQKDSSIAHGGFLTSDEVLTQRIDFTQHCVSSYLQKLVDIEGVEL